LLRSRFDLLYFPLRRVKAVAGISNPLSNIRRFRKLTSLICSDIRSLSCRKIRLRRCAPRLSGLPGRV
jgi:hypothetical protein